MKASIVNSFMPRIGRAQSGTGIYHVMLRGINRQDLFEEPDDYCAFIRILSALPQRKSVVAAFPVCTCHIYAYCLMPNHVHLLVCEKDWKVGEIVKSIASSYAFYYNKKYGRVGHLFQDRFRSEPCNDATYFITLFRYIHQNPVKARLVDSARDYKYSSWGNDYLDMSDQQVCYKRAVINRYGIDELSAWVEMPLPGDVDCIDMENKRIVADETIRQIILEKSGTKSLTEFRLHSKERQKDIVRDVMLKLDAGPRQLSRVSGHPYSIVYKLKKL
jgi:REP element-mobilizing transposase RayT